MSAELEDNAGTEDPRARLDPSHRRPFRVVAALLVAVSALTGCGIFRSGGGTSALKAVAGGTLANADTATTQLRLPYVPPTSRESAVTTLLGPHSQGLSETELRQTISGACQALGLIEVAQADSVEEAVAKLVEDRVVSSSREAEIVSLAHDFSRAENASDVGKFSVSVSCFYVGERTG